jgi:Peptidase M10 serralysin C terminal
VRHSKSARRHRPIAWSGREVIMDFTPGDDRIDLSAIDARTDLAGQQHFRVVADFTGSPAGGMGQIRLTGMPNLLTLVEADVDIDGAADFAFLVQGVGGRILAQDFIL